MQRRRGGSINGGLNGEKLLGCAGQEVNGSMVSKWVISPTYKWGIPWGYNPLTNHLLTSWDIQLEEEFSRKKKPEV